MQDALAERMERYAKASGHPRLVELLSRHAKDQKDKFTLSDDEYQAGHTSCKRVAYAVYRVHRKFVFSAYIKIHHLLHPKNTTILALRSPCG